MTEGLKRSLDDEDLLEGGSTKEQRRGGKVFYTELSELEKIQFAIQYGATCPKVIIESTLGKGSLPFSNPQVIKSTFKNILSSDDTLKITRRQKLLLESKNCSTFVKLADLKVIGSVPITWRAIEETITTKYLIRGVDSSIPLEDIATELKEVGIKFSQIVRFTRKNSEDPIPIVLVKELGYKERQSVPLFHMLHRVSSYTESPKICYNCLRFGHFQKSCDRKQRCAACGDFHPPSTPCLKESICFRCKSKDHKATDSSCEFIKLEKSAINKAIKEKIPIKLAKASLKTKVSYAAITAQTNNPHSTWEVIPSIQKDIQELKSAIAAIQAVLFQPRNTDIPSGHQASLTLPAVTSQLSSELTTIVDATEGQAKEFHTAESFILKEKKYQADIADLKKENRKLGDVVSELHNTVIFLKSETERLTSIIAQRGSPLWHGQNFNSPDFDEQFVSSPMNFGEGT